MPLQISSTTPKTQGTVQSTTERDALQGLPRGFTFEQLRERYELVQSDPAQAAILRAVAEREFGQSLGPVQLQLHKGLSVKDDPVAQALRASFDEVYFGQENLKRDLTPLFRYLADLKRAEAAAAAEHRPFVPPRSGPPKTYVLTGDYGTGKTYLPTAIAKVLYPNDPQPPVLKIEAAGLVHGGTELGGAAPMFVGHGKKLKLTEGSLQELFRDRRPRIILIDDLDKITEPDVKERFLRLFTGVLSEGFFQIETTGEKVDLRGDIIVFTGNFGVEGARKQQLEGEALRQFLKRAAADYFLPDNGHLVDRIRAAGGFLALDTPTEADRRRIIKGKWKELCAEVEQAARDTPGDERDFRLTLNDDALKLFGELANSSRRARDFVANYLESMVRSTVATEVKDDEVWQLRLDGHAEVQRFRHAMQLIANDPDRIIPPEYEADPSLLPFGLVKAVGAPHFVKKTINVPRLADVVASGSCNGTGYYFAAGTSGDNELYLTTARGVQKASLPVELAQCRAMFPIQAVTLNATEVLAVGVNYNDTTGNAEACAFLFDFGVTPPTSRQVAAPPVALQGATLGAVAGDALWVGGRSVRKTDGMWSIPVEASPDVLNGMPIDGGAYRFVRESESWRPTKTLPETNRFGSGAIALDNELWLVGGEETFLSGSSLYGDPRGERLSRAAADIVVFNPTDETFTARGQLPLGLVFPAVLPDGEHRARVAGGFAIHEGQGQDMRYLRSRAIERLVPTPGGARLTHKGELPGDMASTHLTYLPVGVGEQLVAPLAVDGAVVPFVETRDRVAGF
jgi:hypothetical protein